MTDKKTYEYWLIYLIDPVLHDKFIGDNDSTNLYGYTSKKEYLKLWKSQRKNDIFEIRHKELTHGEVNYLASNFQRERIELMEGITRGRKEFRKYKIVMTMNERIEITSNLSFYLNTFVHREHAILENLVKVIRPSFRLIMDILCFSDLFDPYIEEPDYESLSGYDIFKEFIHLYKELLK